MSDLESLLDEMGGIGEPFELFEPHLWKDKLGDSNWKCTVSSHHVDLWSGEGDTPLEAVLNCYTNACAATRSDTPKEEKEVEV